MTWPNPTQRQLCPSCGRFAIREHMVLKGGVCEAYYLCVREHLWQTRWPNVAA